MSHMGFHRSARLVPALCLPFLVAGCSVLLPRHTNSLDSAGESVSVRLLTGADLSTIKDSCNAYNAAFDGRGSATGCCSTAPPEPMTLLFSFVVLKNGQVVFESSDREAAKDVYDELTTKAHATFLPLAALAAPAAGLAAEFAVDFVKKQLEEEATRYSAQFQGQAFFDDFWKVQPDDKELESDTIDGDAYALAARKTTYRQRYCGIEVLRTTKEHPGPSDEHPERTPAFQLLLGLAPSKDHQFLLAAPLVARTDAAKAKVLDDRWWTQVLLYGFFLDAGDEVETHVDAELLANWRTQNGGASDVMYRAEKLLALSFDLPRQNLDKPVPFVVGSSEPKTRLPKQVGGWFGAVPRSFNEIGVPVGEGVGVVKVLVTERDPSNAQKNLEKAATELANSKEKIVERAKETAQAALPKHKPPQ